MKKRGEIQGFVVILLLCLVALLIARPLIANMTQRSIDLTDDHIIQKLNDQKDKEKALEDKIDGFPPVKLSGSITEESIEAGENFVEAIFMPAKGYNLTEGYLISHNTLPLLENSRWLMTLRSYSKGLAIIYTDGVKLETLASPSDKLSYLSYSNICVLPIEDRGLEGAKVMSYATGIKHEELTNMPSVEEIDKIISDHTVDQLSFTIGGRKAYIKYFQGDEFYTSDYASSNGKLVAFYKEGTVCFLPTDSSIWIWNSYVNFDSNNGNSVLSGDGFLSKKFSENMLTKISNPKKIKR